MRIASEAEVGIGFALSTAGMPPGGTQVAGLIWVTDREPGIRQLFAELLPEAEVLAPDELRSLLALGQRPDVLVVDGSQLLELPHQMRRELQRLPRMLVCTGLDLAGLSPALVTGTSVAVLAKPFCVEDLEAALEWLRGAPSKIDPGAVAAPAGRPRLPPGVLVQRRRPRRPAGILPGR